MCRQLSIRSSVEEVLFTLDYITLHYITTILFFFYLVCNYLVCNLSINYFLCNNYNITLLGIKFT